MTVVERVTLNRVAAVAGVSRATVDRVLNGRPGVHPRTQSLVMRAARQLGLAADAPAPGPRGERRIAFVLPAGPNAYINLLAEEAANASAPGVAVEVVRAPTLDPLVVADTVRSVADGSDAIAVIALDVPTIHELTRDLHVASKLVIALASPLTGADLYVGGDNRAAGRVAAQLAARLRYRPGSRVAFYTGNPSYRGHEEREAGFRAVMRQEAPDYVIVPITETRNDAVEFMYETTLAMVRGDEPVNVVYNIGGGNRGIAQAIQDSGRTDVVFIGHELTDYTRRFLLSGAMDVALVQSPADQVRKVLAYVGADDIERSQISARQGGVLPVQIVLRENLA